MNHNSRFNIISKSKEAQFGNFLKPKLESKAVDHMSPTNALSIFKLNSPKAPDAKTMYPSYQQMKQPINSNGKFNIDETDLSGVVMLHKSHIVNK